MNCPKCNSQIPEGTPFCPQCGSPLGSDNNTVNSISASVTPKTTKKNKIAVIILAVVLVVALLVGVFAVVWVTIINREENPPANGGEYKTSVQADTAEYKDDDFEKGTDEKSDKVNSIKVGEYLTLGEYEQDNDTSNGKEDIEWLVVAKDDSKVLVVSKYILDVEPYHNDEGDITWENCTLRQWLNDDFYNEAFSASEQTMIPEVLVSADVNPSYDTDPGNDTYDKVFLLSVDEVCDFYDAIGVDSQEYEFEASPYAISKLERILEEDVDNYCCWLRTPGMDNTCASLLYKNGAIDDMGGTAYWALGTVRPAMWIELK